MMNLIPMAFARNALQLQKASPQVLFGAGVVGMVGATVLACRATLKMEEVLDEAKEKFEKTNTALVQHPDEYTEKDRQRDASLIYFQTGVKIAKNYAPAIILGGLSIAALVGAHRILNNRVIALTAAYGTLEEAFARYRGRVVEELGEEQDRNFRYGTREVELVDPEDARKKKKVTRTSLSADGYSRFFDETCGSWRRDPELNLFFLHSHQKYANDLLHSRGHVFLNEVYDMIGVDRSQAGSVVGWIKSDDGSTDNFVSFGIFEGKTDTVRDFVNGREGAILLDFNVDGVIWDKI
jgi:Family of unknown function (DUF6353)